MPEVFEQPARIYPFSNTEFARQAGLRSVEAKRLRLKQAAQFKPTQDPFAPTVSSTSAALDFAERRLTRVREQLERLDDLAKSEKDAKMLKALADATTRLSEQERILAGRPLPGSRRPREDRARVSAGWIELQPALPGAPVAPAPRTPEVACLDCLVTAPAKPMGWEYDDPTPASPPTGSVLDTTSAPIPPTAPAASA